ncbi:uncharacterized protein UDID_17286 [Ustilago sp. UG-2017a]|nr:uncharacterized protein UDID_17286 [Ustilago sp. UG-2017a]
MTHTPSKAPPKLEIDEDLKAKYPIPIGKLLWILNTIKPDISYAVNTYLATSPNPLKKPYKRPFELSNSNWASDPNTDRRSTSGLVIKVFGSVVNWNSHIQKCVSDSAIKAEYVAGFAATHKALFHWHLLHSLGFGDCVPIVLMDNTGCTQVVKDQVLHSKFKHIDMKYHLICNHILEGDIVMQCIKMNNNDADYLTKPVSQQLLTHTRH